MGLWGPAVFTIPLLAAWYSYEHLEVIRRTYDQTIRALGAAPELGGMVRDGHAGAGRRPRGRDGEHARLLASRARAARDRGAAAPPRPGLPRRTRRRPPARAGLDRAGRCDDPPRHPAARACRRHHRRRVDAVPAERVVTTVGDVGSDPQGRQRVRRAVATATPSVPASRSKRCARRRSTSTTRASSPRSRWCSTGAGCSTISSAEPDLPGATPRRVAGAHDCPRSTDRRSRAPSRCRRSRTAGSGTRAR